MTTVISVFGALWLLALLWLVLIARLQCCLFTTDLPLYEQLGRPVMRWLRWSWPEQRAGPAPGVDVLGLSQGQLNLTTRYGIDEVRSALRLLVWIVVNRPRSSSSAQARRLQRQLRWCGGSLLGGFILLLVVAIRGLQS